MFSAGSFLKFLHLIKQGRCLCRRWWWALGLKTDDGVRWYWSIPLPLARDGWHDTIHSHLLQHNLPHFSVQILKIIETLYRQVPIKLFNQQPAKQHTLSYQWSKTHTQAITIFRSLLSLFSTSSPLISASSTASNILMSLVFASTFYPRISASAAVCSVWEASALD